MPLYYADIITLTRWGQGNYAGLFFLLELSFQYGILDLTMSF